MTVRTQTKKVVWHCSATRPQSDIGAKEIREWHLAKKWSDIGYALVIRRDGTIEAGRALDAVGSHVAGHNSDSIGICLVGGLDAEGKPFANRPDLFTSAQWDAVRVVYQLMRRMYPNAVHFGHRDLSPDLDSDGTVEQHEWLKTCPGFNVNTEIVKL